jgi:serine/threonine protein kinase
VDPANIRPLERALAVYEQWLAAGEPVPPERLLEQHADLRDLLEAMLGDRAAMARDVEQQSGDERELGDFRILEEIGRGGMAVVYRARQRSLNRDVALKVLPGHVTLDAEAVARFRREATLAARLDHPNIVAIHAVGSHHDTNYFAMELVDGRPIARIDPATGRVRSVREVVDMCAKVCDALAHAHAQGGLHRDVKPSNILIGRDGQPMLTDFGLARDLRDLALTRAGSFAGTPHYTAPEQAADSAQVDARADVWGLAATLYELLTRARPFGQPFSTASCNTSRLILCAWCRTCRRNSPRSS